MPIAVFWVRLADLAGRSSVYSMVSRPRNTRDVLIHFRFVLETKLDNEVKFLIYFQAAVAKLSNLLEVTFIAQGFGEAGPLERRLMQVMHHHAGGRHSERDLEFTIIWLLIQHLERVASYDLELLKLFRRRLTSSRDDDYFGARFEVNIASTLIKNKLGFKKSESPDFVVNHQGSSVFLECTCVHLTTVRDKDTRYKIDSAINEKATKPYCNPATALCIDITNINYLSLSTTHPLDSGEALREYARDAISRTVYGSVLLFNYIFDIDANRFASVYIRIDNPHIAPALTSMLDKLFPLGEYRPHPYKVPSWG